MCNMSLCLKEASQFTVYTVLFLSPADRGHCCINRLLCAHSHRVIAALVFGFEKPHGKESSRLHAQHQNDASNEAGHVKLGLGELGFTSIT